LAGIEPGRGEAGVERDERISLAGGGRGGDGDGVLRGDRRGLRIGELGPGLVHGHLVVARIELDEHRAGLDNLVVVDGDLRHRAPDARRNLCDARVHLRIVG